jgi:CheY-like chemotaxis protein
MEEKTVEILLIEDNSEDIDLILRALNQCNLADKVRILKDGEEALEFLNTAMWSCSEAAVLRPKVILLDLKLPKIDGLELLHRLRSDERTRNIPVVILTSSGEDRDRIESYRLGVNSYIVKPVEFENFIRAVGEIGCYWVLLNSPPY